ncbi:hypothetical protein LguiA_011791 [Lonicera macranthoides]
MRKVVALLLVAVAMVMMEGSTTYAICGMYKKDLEACRPAVTWLLPKNPSEECCRALTRADLKCFCSYKNSPLLFSLGIDSGLAMALPSKCHIKNLPSTC